VGSVSGGGTITLGAGFLTAGGDNSDTTFSGVISGTGGLTKTGTGTFTLSGANTFTGTATIDAGMLEVDGSLTSAVVVNTNASLGGSGTITGNITVNGSIAPGNSIGTTTINGDYIQNAGSVYEVEIEPGGTSDKIHAAGTATINGGTVRVTAASGNYTTGTTYDILEADGGVTGTYDTLEKTAMLNMQFNYLANIVQLEILRLNNYADFAQTENQKHVAQNLDSMTGTASGDMQDVMAELDLLSETDLRNAFDLLGPEFYAMLPQVNLSELRSYQRTMTSHMQATRTSRRIASGNALPLDLFAVPTALPVDKKYGFWGKAYGLSENQNKENEYFGYRADAAGAVSGFDSCVGNMIFGVSFGLSKTDVDFETDRAENDIDTVHMGLYGTLAEKWYYIESAFAYGRNDFNSQRRIQVGGIDRTASGDYDGTEWAGYMGGGFFYFVGEFAVVPKIGVEYAEIRVDGFTETGANAINIEANSSHMNSLVTTVGVTTSRLFQRDDNMFVPEFRAQWMHEFKNDPEVASVRFVGASHPADSFAGKWLARPQDTLLLGLGLNVDITHRVTGNINYDFKLGEHYEAHSVALGLRVTF
jgi:fibronectin-binding autotransporter adhesin